MRQPPGLDGNELPKRFAAAAAPLRPIALGFAVGIVCAAGCGGVTAWQLLLLPMHSPLDLLGQYLPGYDVSPAGAAAGGAYGAGLGFVTGWLLAAARNVTVRLWFEVMRARGQVEQTEFLDDI